jgi:LDH2 family malate/lactate/ureidoglycolate dehydrogenase
MQDHVPQISKELVECEARGAEWLHEVRCADCLGCDVESKVMRSDLERFVTDVLARHDVSEREGAITARVLVAADLRGIASHGVARLGRYVKGLKAGYIVPNAPFDVREPVPAIGVIDARNGIGQVVSDLAMDLAVSKARANGLGAVTVKNSNHFGIAGYYVQKAIDAGMVGICMTNSAPLVVPTHGADAILGTNPLAFGAPGADGLDFLLDMATSVVPRGKLEVYDRNRKQIPAGWAVDEHGYDSNNPGLVLANLLKQAGGGILPLGGRGEEFSGYKGYGLALMVDVLCGVLTGSAFGLDVNNLKRVPPPGETAGPRVGHFFLAMDIARFMPLAEFRKRLTELAGMLKNSRKALDHSTIYIHGEKEQTRARLHERAGIPLAANVLESLRKIAAECGIPGPVTVADHLQRQVTSSEEGPLVS